MKVRIKETGEILNIANYDKVTVDECDSYGTPLTFNYEDVEFLQEEDISNNAYKSLKDKCWVEYRRHATSNVESLKYWYDIVFKSAYNLGKQQSTNHSID